VTLYDLLGRVLPQRQPPANPRRIVLILPCCIGDVVLATAALCALRRAYPHAEIEWAVGSWSKGVVERHDLLDRIIDTGPAALPVRTPVALLRFVRLLRGRRFDLAVSLVRSPLMSVALLLTGIPHRAGIDSAGRGFGYTIRAPIDPDVARHEAEVYLDVLRALGVETTGCYANVPVRDEDRAEAEARLAGWPGAARGYLVINPAGGRNPGMVFDDKRWPPASFAALADRLAARLQTGIVLLGGPADGAILAAVDARMRAPRLIIAGGLSFGAIGALAASARLYIGNDTGLTHLAAAAGARTVMIFGPSDPARYAPYVPPERALALWKPFRLPARGVASGVPAAFDWARDGISVDEAEAQIAAFLSR
jgi:ADP-heptose:LPS heptosyltransferase